MNTSKKPNTTEVVPDSFQSFLVSGAHFTNQEEYPIIPERFVSSVIPKKIMPFSKAISFRGDLHDTYISFYSPDETFERVRRTPKRYLSFFQRTAGLIGPDYLIHSDMPIIKQKSLINDNLSLTYYYGLQGIPIIPNLRCGTDELLPEFLFALLNRNSFNAYSRFNSWGSARETFDWSEMCRVQIPLPPIQIQTKQEKK